MLSTPLEFEEGQHRIGNVSRVSFEKSMRNLNSPLRMPRGKVGPKLDQVGPRRRRRPETKRPAATRRAGQEELENEVNAFIEGVATRLTRSAMMYSPPRRRPGSSGKLAPLDDAGSGSKSLAEGDFSFHELYAKNAAKLRSSKGQRRGTMSFIDGLLRARDDEQWIAANPDKWASIKAEKHGATPEPTERPEFDGRIR